MDLILHFVNFSTKYSNNQTEIGASIMNTRDIVKNIVIEEFSKLTLLIETDFATNYKRKVNNFCSAKWMSL